jgi:ABC-type spermidine/putrescine transport system permease subunit II
MSRWRCLTSSSSSTRGSRPWRPELEEAARSLGATQWQVTRRVTLPWIAPGIIAGGLFAFAVSSIPAVICL